MIEISYASILVAISIIWCTVRVICGVKNKTASIKRELQLFLVYICVVVVVRFTFFPFFKVDGEIQPLVFDTARVFPFRLNLIPFVYLFDYPTLKEILINVIGNVTMFIPLGIVWPSVYKKLDTHIKVIMSGFFTSLCIEILQLPLCNQVSDVDDLILNTVGFAMGYLIFLLASRIKKAKVDNNHGI